MIGPLKNSTELTQTMWKLYPFAVVPASGHLIDDTDAWCNARLGESAVTFDNGTTFRPMRRDGFYIKDALNWARRYRVYCFKDELRAVEFKLTWG